MKKLYCVLFLVVLSLSASAQIDPSLEKSIDALFIDWNSPNHPGGALGVVKEGRLLYSKAYGLASLEYLVPNTPGTRFNIASVSKQFTAMGIVKLHLEGKLSVDDNVRLHIPELPVFGHTVTLRHMLHHTSGLRSLHAMLSLAGWRGDDSRTNEDLMRFMRDQKGLNFIPGDEYMYSNTGYILMAVLIERITGEDFRDWMEKEIFLPLSLADTYVEDRYDRVVPNNATSYSGSKQRGFMREVEYWGYTGSGNVHSTIFDLLKWYKNFHQPQEGWEQAFAMMQTVDAFNSGQPNDYAFGVRIGFHRDEKMISHSGSIGGFRAFGCTFPEKKVEIVVLTNFSSSSAGEKALAIADLLFGNPDEEIPRLEMSSVEIDPSLFDEYTGTYTVKEDLERMIDIISEENDLFLQSTGQARIKLSAASPSVFFNNERQIKIVFDESDTNSYTMTERGREFSGLKTVKFLPTEKDLLEIAGHYWSSELNTRYSFSVRDGQLFGYHTRHGEFHVVALKKDFYFCQSAPMRTITVGRDESGRITGLHVTNSRVRNLWLEKMD